MKCKLREVICFAYRRKEEAHGQNQYLLKKVFSEKAIREVKAGLQRFQNQALQVHGLRYRQQYRVVLRLGASFQNLQRAAGV